MLMVMAGQSIEDGLVMQLHAGSLRNHNQSLFERFGPDRGADIPVAAEYTRNLRPAPERVRQRRAVPPAALHARRVHLLAGAGAARRTLPGGPARSGVVVSRQHRRHDALPASA